MSIVNGSIQIANYTEAEWLAWNGVLKSGQVAISTDKFYGTTNCAKYKIGNGVDTWANLDYHPDTTGSATTGSNGITVAAGDAKLGGNLIQDTTIDASTFDFKVTGVPKANFTTSFESSQTLFGLPINGQGMKYDLTYDINGDPESYVLVSVSDKTNIGGSVAADMVYINLATGESCTLSADANGILILTTDGVNGTGIEIDRATEIIDIIVAGLNKISISSGGITFTDFAGGGTQMLTVDNAGLVGVSAVPTATPTVLTLDRFGNTTTGSSADANIIHRVTTIPANTIADQDIIESVMFMVKNASSNDTGYTIVLSNTNLGVGSNSISGYGFNGLVDSFITIANIAVLTFLNAAKVTYAYLNASSAPYVSVSATINAYDPYQSGGGAIATAAGINNNQSVVPIDWTQPVYAHWITQSSNAARVRGFEAGFIRLIKAP